MGHTSRELGVENYLGKLG